MCRQKSVGQRVQLAYNENRVPDEGRDEVGGRVESKAGAFVVDAGTTDDWRKMDPGRAICTEFFST